MRNPLRAAYCRTFQTVFRLALPILPYREPVQLDGLEAIPPLLEGKGVRSVLLVTDRSVRGLGLTAPLEGALKDRGIACAVYDGTVPNPTIQNVEEARQRYLDAGAQAILAVGGGSAMDCAKAVGARIARPRKPVRRMRGILKVLRPTPLTIAVPTTAGTGSEATLAAVITDPEHKYKYPINDFPLIPDYAVLDPAITVGLPPFVTATTGMDALTHAVEAYIGNSATYGTRKDALLAVKLIFENIDEAWENGRNVRARRNMLRASFCAGCAFYKSYVGYVHAIAHSLGGEYNVPHGLANAVILPMMLEAYGKKIDRKLARLAIAAGLADEHTPCGEAAARFIREIKEMKKRFGIGDRIPEIQEKDIPRLARYADREANPLYPVPVLMDAGELEKFYHRLR